MYKIFWKLDGEQCSVVVDTTEEAEKICRELTQDGQYDEVFFEDYDEEN